MSTPSRRYLAVWLRRLATDRIARRSSTPDDALIIAGPVKGALRLTAVNDAAAEKRLKAGMPLADARAMYPAIAVADADEAADARLLEAIADWCDRYTPLVGLDPPDGLVLDVTGCAHLFGGEAALCGDLTRRLGAQGYRARVAVAGTVGCAWAVARFSSLPRSWRVVGEADRVEVIPSGEERETVSPLPLAALRLDAEIIDALAQVGLKRIADVLGRPRAPLAARFGQAFVRRLDQALGIEDEPITPRLPVPAAMAEQRFAEPIALEQDVLGTIERLAGRLGAMLERRGEGARLLQAALFRTDGKVFRLEVGTAEPLREPARVRRLFTDRLAVIGDEVDPGFGFDVVRLAALATERCEPAQTGLAAPDHAAELAHLIDRLGARFGGRRVARLVPQDTHIPEFAAMAVGAAQMRAHAACPGRSAGRSLALQTRDPGGFGAPGSRISGAPFHAAPHPGHAQLDSLIPTRPIRLFERPEPIMAIAEVPDHAPGRFHWRGVWHEVVRAEGPERIATEWWRDENSRARTRDYFRVEIREGVRVWLYREGLFDGVTPPRWFAHGVFA
jgi:protein ImuB